jgi:hypothetical protein
MSAPSDSDEDGRPARLAQASELGEDWLRARLGRDIFAESLEVSSSDSIRAERERFPNQLFFNN